MKYAGSFLSSLRTVFVVVSLFGVTAYGQEAQIATKPESTTTEINQKVSQEPAPKQDVQTNSGKGADFGPAHDTENRIVATVGSDGIQHVEIVGGEYYFKPNDIVVRVNVPVEFKVKKAPGFVSHDITANAPDAGINFETELSTDWKTIRFTPTKIGKYEIMCDKKFLWFKSHKDRGMDGFIEVVQ